MKKTNRIDTTFRALRRSGRAAFVAYMTAGDPSLRWTRRLVCALERSGCDIVELGVPFSDPLADGVINQRAAFRALRASTTLKKILDNVSEIRKESQIPLVIFSYFNPIHRMGVRQFAQRASLAGVDGVLILDVPPEESQQLRQELAHHGLKMIHLVAPTTSDARICAIARKADGFIYCVSRTGVTGAQTSVLEEVRSLVRKIRLRTKIPVVVGFGISTPQHVRQMSRSADGVVVGSAIVSQIEKHPKNPLPAVTRFVGRLTRTLRNIHAR